MLLVGLTLHWDRWLGPPAELTNPSQLVTLHAFVCVCSHKKRKSSTGRLAVATTVDGSVLVWNMTGESVCVCAHACGRLFLEYYP